MLKSKIKPTFVHMTPHGPWDGPGTPPKPCETIIKRRKTIRKHNNLKHTVFSWFFKFSRRVAGSLSSRLLPSMVVELLPQIAILNSFLETTSLIVDATV